MLKINKTSEPNFLKEFKKKEKPKNWKDFDFGIKKELKNYMLENEQKIGNNSYCPYCERKIIASKNSQIEHIKPKDRFPELFSNYENFITGCLNIESCGSKKGNKWSELFVNPVIYEPSKYFSYNRMTGEIIPKKDITDIDLEKANYTIEILNLNDDKRLLKGRKSVIKILQKYQKIYKDEKILKEISEDLDFPTLRNFLIESFND